MLVAGQHAVSPHLAQTLRLRGRARICARLSTVNNLCTVVQGWHLFLCNKFKNPQMLNLLMQNSLPRQGPLNPILVAGTFVHTVPHARRVRVGFCVLSWRVFVMA